MASNLDFSLEDLLAALPPSLTSLILEAGYRASFFREPPLLLGDWPGAGRPRRWAAWCQDTTLWGRLPLLQRLTMRGMATSGDIPCPSQLSLLSALTHLSFEDSLVRYQGQSTRGLEGLRYLDLGHLGSGASTTPSALANLTALTYLHFFGAWASNCWVRSTGGEWERHGFLF